MPKLKNVKCKSGCGRYLKKSNGEFCSHCGREYRALRKQRRHSHLSDNDIMKMTIQNIEQRKMERLNFANRLPRT